MKICDSGFFYEDMSFLLKIGFCYKYAGFLSKKDNSVNIYKDKGLKWEKNKLKDQNVT